MGTFKVIPKEIKEQIIKRIKEEGASVSQVSKDHGISNKTIYHWLNNELVKIPSYREFAHLKKQNTDLLTLIGQLTVEVKKLKKN